MRQVKSVYLDNLNIIDRHLKLEFFFNSLIFGFILFILKYCLKSKKTSNYHLICLEVYFLGQSFNTNISKIENYNHYFINVQQQHMLRTKECRLYRNSCENIKYVINYNLQVNLIFVTRFT